MAIAEEDGLIVDLVVGGLNRTAARECAQSRRVDARRLYAVARFFKLMDQTPPIEPSQDLVEATLKRVARVSNP